MKNRSLRFIIGVCIAFLLQIFGGIAIAHAGGVTLDDEAHLFYRYEPELELVVGSAPFDVEIVTRSFQLSYVDRDALCQARAKSHGSNIVVFVISTRLPTYGVCSLGTTIPVDELNNVVQAEALLAQTHPTAPAQGVPYIITQLASIARAHPRSGEDDFIAGIKSFASKITHKGGPGAGLLIAGLFVVVFVIAFVILLRFRRGERAVSSRVLDDLPYDSMYEPTAGTDAPEGQPYEVTVSAPKSSSSASPIPEWLLAPYPALPPPSPKQSAEVTPADEWDWVDDLLAVPSNEEKHSGHKGE